MHDVLASGEVSWHYSVHRDGHIEQHVLDADASWGAGIKFSLGYAAYLSDMSISWIEECWQRQINPNLIVINIEHEGRPGIALTAVQTAATVALHQELSHRHSIPLTPEFVVGHNQINNVGRPYDPGSAFPWSAILR